MKPEELEGADLLLRDGGLVEVQQKVVATVSALLSSLT